MNASNRWCPNFCCNNQQGPMIIYFRSIDVHVVPVTASCTRLHIRRIPYLNIGDVEHKDASKAHVTGIPKLVAFLPLYSVFKGDCNRSKTYHVSSKWQGVCTAILDPIQKKGIPLWKGSSISRAGFTCSRTLSPATLRGVVTSIFPSQDSLIIDQETATTTANTLNTTSFVYPYHPHL